MFTRSQEGTQVAKLSKQNGVFDTIHRHAQFSVGELARGKSVTARERAGQQVVRVALCISTACFVYSSYQYYCYYFSLPFLFC